MPTSTETMVAYIPRMTVFLEENKNIEPPRLAKNVNADVEQVQDVSTQPVKTGLSRNTKMIIGAGVIGGIAAVTALAVTLGVIFGPKTSATTTTTGTTSTTRTTTSTTTTSTSSTTPVAAPANMLAYRGNNNQTYIFLLTGALGGSLWGTTIYTDDSNLATAAVHAGFVQVGQTSVVTVIVLPGQSSYSSTTQNGVTSSSWGGWSGSYSFVSANG